MTTVICVPWSVVVYERDMIRFSKVYFRVLTIDERCKLVPSLPMILGRPKSYVMYLHCRWKSPYVGHDMKTVTNVPHSVVWFCGDMVRHVEVSLRELSVDKWVWIGSIPEHVRE